MPLAWLGDVALLQRLEVGYPGHLVMALGAVRRLELLQKKRLTEGLSLNEASWPGSRGTVMGPLDGERSWSGRLGSRKWAAHLLPAGSRCQKLYPSARGIRPRLPARSLDQDAGLSVAGLLSGGAGWAGKGKADGDTGQNCSRSVEPSMASVDVSPSMDTSVTSSKYPAPTNSWCFVAS